MHFAWERRGFGSWIERPTPPPGGGAPLERPSEAGPSAHRLGVGWRAPTAGASAAPPAIDRAPNGWGAVFRMVDPVPRLPARADVALRHTYASKRRR